MKTESGDYTNDAWSLVPFLNIALRCKNQCYLGKKNLLVDFFKWATCEKIENV